MNLGLRRTAVLVIVAFVVSLTQPTYAATPLTVTQAIATQNGSSQTVRGYVVGQPTATNTVVTSNYPSDLELNNSVNGSTPWHGKISVLLQWNAEDPVSTFEMRRNDVIWNDWQHNRNPFIDHPEWAAQVYG